MTDGLKPEHREAIVALLSVEEKVERAVLFGSRTTQTHSVTSDVDIALFGEYLTSTDLANISASMDTIPMAQSVDLVLYRSIDNPVLLKHIQEHGIELYRQHIEFSGTREIKRNHVMLDPNDNQYDIKGWRDMTFSEAVQINPKVQLERGVTYPFVDMAAVIPNSPCVYAPTRRKFTGGGSRFSSGDTLMARLTQCLEKGKVARYCSDNQLSLAHGSTEFIVIRGRDTITDTLFSYYLTRWEKVCQYAIDHRIGTTRQRVSIESLDHLKIPIPPLSEQYAIAHILGSLDDKIELNRRMNETLEVMTRTLFKSWFVDFDPVRAKMEGRDTGLPKEVADLFPSRLVNSELGEIPDGWEIYCLDDLAKHHTLTVSPSIYPEKTFEHFSIPAYDRDRMPSIDSGESIRSNKTIVPYDAVLLSKLNPEIPRVWISGASSGSLQICSTEFLAFTARPPANRGLLFSLFTDATFREVLCSMVTGTSRSHQRVPPVALKRCKVLSGVPDLFDKFGKFSILLLDQTCRRRTESRIILSLRDLLLPKLMSGEVCLRENIKTLKTIV